MRISDVMRAPVRVAEDHHFRRIRKLILRRERSPEQWRDSQCWKEAGRGAGCRDVLRLLFPGYIVAGGLISTEAREYARAITVRCELRRRGCQTPLAHLRLALPDAKQPLRMRVRQWPQQHCIEDAENRRVGADSKRERYDCDARPAWALADSPQRHADVAGEAFPESPSPNRAHILANECGVPQGAAGGIQVLSLLRLRLDVRAEFAL